MEPDALITLTNAEYDELYKAQRLLEHLRAAGVDNWDGWDYAIESYQEEMGDDERSN